jgi:hypothetical protein
MSARILLFFMLNALLASPCFADQAETIASHERLVETDLKSLRAIQIKGRSKAAIERENELEIERLLDLEIPRREAGRVRSVDPETAAKMLQSIELHPIVAHNAISNYDLKEAGIGFCFGRATYAHIMALGLGVQKEALKKAFVVGPMQTGNTTWGFHVATLVRSGNEWLALDSVPGDKPLTIRDWYGYFKRQSVDGKLTLYITEPEKFTTDGRSYTQVQLGLNLTREQDWYSGYFRDLMNWFKSEPDYRKLELEPPAAFKERLTKNPYEPFKLTKTKLMQSCAAYLNSVL